MNIKSILTTVAIGIILCGCSDSFEPESSPSGEISVSISVKTQNQVLTRAGDESTDPIPTRYVLEYIGSDGVSQRETSTDGSFNVILKFGEAYKCNFWADSDDGSQYDVSNLAAVEIVSQPTAPAYFASQTIVPGQGKSENYDVTLTHAVAKIVYVQTEDFSVGDKTLNITFDKKFSFNVENGTVSEIVSKPFVNSFSGISKESKGKIIGTSYVFAPSDESVLATITAEMESEGSGRIITNVPLRRNYVTNIKGNFSDLYNSDIVVSTDPQWNTPDNVIEVWDGVSVSIPKEYKGVLSSDETVTINITRPSELAWLAQETAKKGVTMKGYVFKLCNDIYLGNHEWTPIGLNEYFAGSIIGSNFAIYDLKITKSDNRFIGFVGACEDANIYGLSDLRIYGSIDVDLKESRTYYIGGVCGNADHSFIQNCDSHLTINVNSMVDNAYAYVGGVVAYTQDCELITNNAYGNIYVNADGGVVTVGGLAGLVRFSYPKDFVGLEFDAGTNYSANITLKNAQASDVIGGYIGQLLDFRDGGKSMNFSKFKSSANVILKDCNMTSAGVWIGRFSGSGNSQSQLGQYGECSGDIIQENCNHISAGWMGGELLLGNYTLTLNNPSVGYGGSLSRFGSQSTDSGSKIIEN